MDDEADPDNLNNYASFLSMAGAEHAALPILQYLNNKYPKNSTILNNIGQAWFGLGDMLNAKKYLHDCTKLDSNHSQANLSLSSIYHAQRDSQQAVYYLKRSIKETYDPEKEAELARLGVTLTYDDMPALNYPMKNDPLRLVEFVQSFPEEDQRNLDDLEKYYAIVRYQNGLKILGDQLSELGYRLNKKSSEFNLKMSFDKQYSEEVLRMLSSPAHILASRLLQLRAIKMQSMSPAPMQLLLPISPPADELDRVKTVGELTAEMGSVYARYQLELITLREADSMLGPVHSCEEADMRTNAYLAKAAGIRRRMIQSIKERFVEKSPQVREAIKTELYGRPDAPYLSDDELTYTLVTGFMEGTGDPETKDIVARTAYLSVSQFANKVVTTEGRYQKCDGGNSQIRNETAVLDLNAYYKNELVCEFEKKVETSVYVFKFKCNIIKDDPSSRIKKKAALTQKGNGKSSTNHGTEGGPVTRGPGVDLFNDQEFFAENSYLSYGPLTEEKKDLSQFSIEYNRWGNLVGLDLQINKEGTALADPDSVNSGMESRWSWSAAGSLNNGPLHKLLIKK
jgi:hypothetical protein